MILTDVDKLHTTSTHVKFDEDDIAAFQENISRLLAEFPDDALGLAAPQIDIFERFFIARLSSGVYIFVNPVIAKIGATACSVESCLSLPNVTRHVGRHLQVAVSADIIYKVNTLKEVEVIDNASEMTFNFRDAFIIQHENDHLDGILIIDLPVYQDDQQRLINERIDKRRMKVAAKRQQKKNEVPSPTQTNVPKKIGPKRAARLKKKKEQERRARRKARKQEKIRVEIQERIKAREEGILSDALDHHSEH